MNVCVYLGSGVGTADGTGREGCAVGRATGARVGRGPALAATLPETGGRDGASVGGRDGAPGRVVGRGAASDGTAEGAAEGGSVGGAEGAPGAVVGMRVVGAREGGVELTVGVRGVRGLRVGVPGAADEPDVVVGVLVAVVMLYPLKAVGVGAAVVVGVRVGLGGLGTTVLR